MCDYRESCGYYFNARVCVFKSLLLIIEEGGKLWKNKYECYFNIKGNYSGGQ